PDLHLAPLDRAAFDTLHAGSVLQREWPGRVLAVLHADCLHAVQLHRELVALRADLVGVPFAARLVDDRHGNGGDVDDRARTVLRLGADIPDVDLVAGCGAHFRRIGAAEENTAVGVRRGPEFGADLEIPVGILRDEIAALA